MVSEYETVHMNNGQHVGNEYLSSVFVLQARWLNLREEKSWQRCMYYTDRQTDRHDDNDKQFRCSLPCVDRPNLFW